MCILCHKYTFSLSQGKKKFNINNEELIELHIDINDPPTQPFDGYDYVQPLDIL